MERDDAAAFGSLLLASHASLRDRLRVSCAALDRLVEAAMASGRARRAPDRRRFRRLRRGLLPPAGSARRAHAD